jgi:hypothetical protein
MMTLIAATLLLAPLQYSFDAGSTLSYDSRIEFEGFIPILGGNEGKCVVEMSVSVAGLKPTKEGTVRAANEITKFKVAFNEAVLPLDVTSVQTYFPRTTISLERSGRIVESDAPNIKLPVRLPGLDVKRFPDITYVPIQFPDKELVNGDTWTFKREFGESEIGYTCTVGERKGSAVIINVAIRQEYELLEDAALEVVTDEKDAEARVKTVLTGSGIVLFDTERGAVVKAEMVNDAVSDVTKIVDGSKSKRDLRTTFSLSLQVPKAGPASVQSGSWLTNAWATVQGLARNAVQTTLSWWAMAKLAFHSKLAKQRMTGG